jgi:hypothetical protein
MVTIIVIIASILIILIMNQLSASKSFTVTTLQDGKDGRDAADIVVSPKAVVYPAIGAVCIRTTPKLIHVKYTDSEGTEFSNITQIVSYDAPDGITVTKKHTTADPSFYYIQVSIPDGFNEEGTVEVVVNMDNYENGSHGSATKTVEGIKLSFDIQQGVPNTIIEQDIHYPSDSLGNVLYDETYYKGQITGREVRGAEKLYGADGVQISKAFIGAKVTIQKGSNVAGMVIYEIKPQLLGSFDAHELHQFNFVPDIVPTTYNPNFEDGDQTLANDCSDTICIDAYGPGSSQAITRWLYLPDEATWQYRRITIYRWATITGLRPVGTQYTINIGSQNENNIKDVRRRLHQIVEIPGYTIGISHKVVLWSDGNNWVLLEDSEMDADNIVTVE